MNNILVHIAENDERGERSGKAPNIEFGDKKEIFLSLETRDLKGVPIETSSDRVIEIYGNRVKHNCKTVYWAGNRMWNLYDLPADYALGLLMLLQKSKEWYAMSGWSELVDKFDSGDIITGKDMELDEDYQPIVVIPNQLGIPFQKRNMVDIKVYEQAELWEIPVKPLVEWVKTHLLGGDHGGPEVTVNSWKPGYYQIPLLDDDVSSLYQWQSTHQSVLKIIGVNPLDD